MTCPFEDATTMTTPTTYEPNCTVGEYSWSNVEYPNRYRPGPYHLFVWESQTVWECIGYRRWRCVSHPDRQDKSPIDALWSASTRDKGLVRDKMREIVERWMRDHPATEGGE